MLKACMYFCGPFTFVASILLFILMGMIQHGSWTFTVLAAKHDWETKAKARCCRNAAIFYLVVSVLLIAMSVIDSFLFDFGDLQKELEVSRRHRTLPSLRRIFWKKREERRKRVQFYELQRSIRRSRKLDPAALQATSEYSAALAGHSEASSAATTPQTLPGGESQLREGAEVEMEVPRGRGRRFFGRGATDVVVEGEHPAPPPREVTSILQANWSSRPPLLGAAPTAPVARTAASTIDFNVEQPPTTTDERRATTDYI